MVIQWHQFRFCYILQGFLPTGSLFGIREHDFPCIEVALSSNHESIWTCTSLLIKVHIDQGRVLGEVHCCYQIQPPHGPMLVHGRLLFSLY